MGDVMDELVKPLGAPNAADDDGTEIDELRVAILGRPNVGKSSLLNRLTASERAIVSDIAGASDGVTGSKRGETGCNGVAYLARDPGEGGGEAGC